MSQKIEAVGFIWDGSAMIPLDRFRALASRQFRPGQKYALVPHRGRSEAAHGLYFACVQLSWKNLPEPFASRFPSSEHFRRWCLIQEGLADEHTMLCDNDIKAQATAALCRSIDGYAVIRLSGPVVTVWTAKSQSHHAMGHEAFNDSMKRVLERCADMLGITVAELTENAKKQMQTLKEE